MIKQVTLQPGILNSIVSPFLATLMAPRSVQFAGGAAHAFASAVEFTVQVAADAFTPPASCKQTKRHAAKIVLPKKGRVIVVPITFPSGRTFTDTSACQTARNERRSSPPRLRFSCGDRIQKR